MIEDKINSNESEGMFNEFINEELDKLIEDLVNSGNMTENGSEIVIEIDDIVSPTFIYDDFGFGYLDGKGILKPGREVGTYTFKIPFKRMMELIKEKLGLPNLIKEGHGKIKEISYDYKTFGPTGIILDKKRTFKKAFKTSIGIEEYDPKKDKFNIIFRRKDRRYKLPERIEKPKYKAVVFYAGDISYSTFGERLKEEKKLINFIRNWVNYNYGSKNVEHRFFVHDTKAYEVPEEQFYKISNAGGTWAFSVFDVIDRIARNDYNISTTNFYFFYFGDGETFSDDCEKIIDILNERLIPIFNRIGVVEVFPGGFSELYSALSNSYGEENGHIKFAELKERKETIEVIKKIFS